MSRGKYKISTPVFLQGGEYCRCNVTMAENNIFEVCLILGFDSQGAGIHSTERGLLASDGGDE